VKPCNRKRLCFKLCFILLHSVSFCSFCVTLFHSVSFCFMLRVTAPSRNNFINLYFVKPSIEHARHAIVRTTQRRCSFNILIDSCADASNARNATNPPGRGAACTSNPRSRVSRKMTGVNANAARCSDRFLEAARRRRTAMRRAISECA